MNADAFRQLYDYHFRENRKLWDIYITSLSQDQFTQPVAYSIGSLRDHIVHLTEVDDIWFSELKGLTEPVIPFIAEGDDRTKIRQQWDAVEQMMRDYLAGLGDEMLFAKPIDVAGAAACSQSWNRSSSPDTQAVERFGR
jgi:uncharacterized damage-inducible protein DinB